MVKFIFQMYLAESIFFLQISIFTTFFFQLNRTITTTTTTNNNINYPGAKHC